MGVQEGGREVGGRRGSRGEGGNVGKRDREGGQQDEIAAVHDWQLLLAEQTGYMP